MIIKKLVSAGIMAATACIAAAPAQAVSFASFSVAPGAVVWANNGSDGSAATYRGNGAGGTLTTTATVGGQPELATPGAVNASFSFLNALGSLVTNAPAVFSLTATVANSPAQTMFGFKLQQSLAGSFSFLSTAPITVGATVFSAGANLLSATFSATSIVGQSGGSIGSFSGSTGGGSTVAYTSDFLNFDNTTDRGFSLTLDAIVSLVGNVNQGLNNASNSALRSFRTTASGSFSAEPSPLVPALPEPQTWAMLIVGFGMVGLIARRRTRLATTLG